MDVDDIYYAMLDDLGLVGELVTTLSDLMNKKGYLSTKDLLKEAKELRDKYDELLVGGSSLDDVIGDIEDELEEE